VQFVHRLAAYLLWAAVMAHAVDTVRTMRGGAALSVALALAVTLQGGLGILTLLYQVPIGLALMHQGMAVVVLIIAVMNADRMTPR
jgi:heme a synthase